MRLGEQVSPSHLDCISSGCLSLDVALGGGWARGRIVEVRVRGLGLVVVVLWGIQQWG